MTSVIRNNKLLLIAMVVCYGAAAFAQMPAADEPPTTVDEAAAVSDAAPVVEPVSENDQFIINVNRIISMCTDEFAKVEASAMADIPEGALSVQTTVAHQNISWALDRYKVPCKSREYWKTKRDNTLAGQRLEDGDLRLSNTLLDVIDKAHADWVEVMDTYNQLVDSTRERRLQKELEELNAEEEMEQNLLMEQQEKERQIKNEKLIKQKQENLRKTEEERTRIRNESEFRKSVSESQRNQNNQTTDEAN